MQAWNDMPFAIGEREEKKLMQWTKWSLLRAVASEGLNAEALRSLPADLLRRKLLLRTSCREAGNYINKTDYYILNVQAARLADPQKWLAESRLAARPRTGFARQIAE